MKVGIIAEPLDAGSPGFQTYARRLTRALFDGAQHDYRLIRRRPGYDAGVREEPLPKIPGGAIAKQLAMPLVLLPRGYDLVHDLYHFPPYLYPTPYTRVMTIGDLTPLLLPTHRSANVVWHRLLVARLARRCHHIVTFSACSKRDIVRLLGVGPENVTVTHLAADERFSPGDARAARDMLQAKYAIPTQRFFLQVGTIEPRKNLRATLAAFRQIAAETPDVSLAIVGPEGWGATELDDLANVPELSGRVVKLGHVPEDDLVQLYRAATALVYPSLYEGFGLPPLEAMQSGCPTIVSQTSSLPEVVGDAGLLVDPNDPGELAARMLQVAQDRELGIALMQKGLARAQSFSWQRTAEATLGGYDRARSRGSRVGRRSLGPLL